MKVRSPRETASRSLDWYVSRSGRARGWYWSTELLVVVDAAAITVSALLLPNNTTVSGTLGAVATLLISVRAIFHWRENWLRFTLVCTAIISQLRLYDARAAPYNSSKESERDMKLILRLNEIEAQESAAWAALIASTASDPKARENKG